MAAFWSIGAFHTIAAVDRILDREDFTLRDVLEAEDVVQEVMTPNTKLVDYLRQEDIIRQLVDLVAESHGPEVVEKAAAEPSAEADKPTDSQKLPTSSGQDTTGSLSLSPPGEATLQEEVDLPKIATELLSADVWSITDALMANDDAMTRLWGILSDRVDDLSGPQLVQAKDRLANFTKIAENLLEKRTEPMLDYIRTIPNLVDMFMNHVDNPPLVDLLLKIITTDHPDSPTGILSVLHEQRLIPKMIARLAPDVPHSEQMAVGDFLKAFIAISSSNKVESCSIGPNELSRQLVSDECMSELIGLMLKGGSGMCIAVGIIIEIIRKNNSDYDYIQVLYTTLETHPPTDRDTIYLGGMLRQFAEVIPKFQEMLESTHPPDMEMPFGTIKPLGFERFRICELYAELLHCSNMRLLNDPRGEEVVRQRDQEREKTYGNALMDIFAERKSSVVSTGSADGSLVHDESAKLYSGDDSQHENDIHSPPPLATTPPIQGEHMQVDTPPPRDANLTATGPELEALLKDQEKSIRQNPVVGDQLKLALNDNGCISTVFNMLFKFPWNNFLHNVVFDIVQQIFNGSIQEGFNKFLAINLFTQDHITAKIVEGQNNNDAYEAEKGARLGYVGHLTLISEEVVKFAAMFPPENVSPDVASALASPEWTQYVGHTLLKLREQYNTMLGGRKGNEDGQDVEEMILARNEGSEPADRLSHLELEDSGDRFSRYMSNQLSSLSGHFGSSDEEDDDDWESADQSRQRNFGYRELENSDDDDETVETGNDDLGLVRSHSYNNQ